jgi:hypothetical protein
MQETCGSSRMLHAPTLIFWTLMFKSKSLPHSSAFPRLRDGTVESATEGSRTVQVERLTAHRYRPKEGHMCRCARITQLLARVLARMHRTDFGMPIRRKPSTAASGSFVSGTETGFGGHEFATTNPPFNLCSGAGHPWSATTHSMLIRSLHRLPSKTIH